MTGTANGSLLVSYGSEGSTTGSSSIGLWFTEATGVLTNGFVYNADSTIWLNLDWDITQNVTWTLIS